MLRFSNINSVPTSEETSFLTTFYGLYFSHLYTHITHYKSWWTVCVGSHPCTALWTLLLLRLCLNCIFPRVLALTFNLASLQDQALCYVFLSWGQFNKAIAYIVLKIIFFSPTLQKYLLNTVHIFTIAFYFQRWQLFLF